VHADNAADLERAVNERSAPQKRVPRASELRLHDARPLEQDVSADPRTLALSLGSVQLLERLGAWQPEAAAPIFRVHVSQAPAGITLIPVVHEQGAGHMADGYARASGRHGVIIGQNGPGISNAVTAIDAEAKRVTLASGATVAYDSLMTTMPLDITLRMLGKPEWADGLTHSSSHIIGVGIRGACVDAGGRGAC
jgi:hypothetical protein